MEQSVLNGEVETDLNTIDIIMQTIIKIEPLIDDCVAVVEKCQAAKSSSRLVKYE